LSEKTIPKKNFNFRKKQKANSANKLCFDILSPNKIPHLTFSQKKLITPLQLHLPVKKTDLPKRTPLPILIHRLLEYGITQKKQRDIDST